MKRVSSIKAYDMQNSIRKDIGLPKAIDKDVYGKSFNNT